jgi:hypothetical protein
MPRANFELLLPGVNVLSLPSGANKSINHVRSAIVSESSFGVARRKPAGFLPPTSYFYRYLRIDYQRGFCLNRNHDVDDVGQLFTGVVGDPSNGSFPFNGEANFNGAYTEGMAVSADSLRERALIKARIALKATDINLGVAFGERNATARLLGDTATRLAKSLRALRRGEVRRAMRELGISGKKNEPRGGSIPQKWLELQYGWKPLLSDVYGACDALSKRGRSDYRVTAKGSVREDIARSLVRDVTPSDTGANVVVEGWKGAFARIDALPINETKRSLSSLGITNPLLIGWELVPFSFVVDWALPIGGWLESLDATLGFQIEGYSNSFFVRVNWVDDVDGFAKKPLNTGWRRSQFKGTKKLIQLSRIVGESVPLPSFPSFKDPRSLGHMANGLALLTQVFGRR